MDSKIDSFTRSFSMGAKAELVHFLENYFGIAAGENKGGGSSSTSSVTKEVELYPDTPDASGNATPGIVGGFTNVRRILPYLAHAGDGYWVTYFRVPHDYVSTPTVIVTGVVNATSGVTRIKVGTSIVAAGASLDAATVDETAQNITVPGTALQRFDTTFTITGSTPAAGKSMAVKITRNASNVADTCTASLGLWGVTFTYST